MNKDEKQEMLAMLQESRKALFDSLDGVDATKSTEIPAPGRWSVRDCVEHLAVSEEYLFAQIGQAIPIAEPKLNSEREERIRRMGPDRSSSVEAPAESRPCGRFATLAEALRHFQASREKTIRFVESNEEDLRAQLATHPLFGEVNCHEMLLMMAVHPLRHVKQIEEIKATLG